MVVFQILDFVFRFFRHLSTFTVSDSTLDFGFHLVCKYLFSQVLSVSKNNVKSIFCKVPLLYITEKYAYASINFIVFHAYVANWIP